MTIQEFQQLPPSTQTELFVSGLLPDSIMDYLYSFNETTLDFDIFSTLDDDFLDWDSIDYEDDYTTDEDDYFYDLKDI